MIAESIVEMQVCGVRLRREVLPQTTVIVWYHNPGLVWQSIGVWEERENDLYVYNYGQIEKLEEILKFIRTYERLNG